MKKVIKQLGTAVLAALLFSACSLPDREGIAANPDLSPPRLVEIRAGKGPELQLLFDEAVRPENERGSLDSGAPVRLEVREENTIVLIPETKLPPGSLCRLPLTVEDKGGNSTRFILPFWAWNPDLPTLLINEFTPEGSAKSENNPDCIEFYVKEGGDCAGLCLYYGTRRFYSYRYVFPSLRVETGEYIILHCRREFVAGEISESKDKTESTGKLSHDEAWDLWLPEDRGMSANNGVLSLYSSPDGRLEDGVVYSDRDPEPDDKYLGWTAQTFDAVADLYKEGGWKFSSESISPAEAIRSSDSTATRSVCRSSDSGDSNRADDWHITPTSGKTFGDKNTDAVYVPPPKD